MRGPTPTETIGRHHVGNALVLYARDRISHQAQSLALAVADDADHDIVVLDLHGALPMGIWEAVAGALPRRHRRRGLRLIVCGAGQDVTSLAGQWLSDRLGRPVLVPYGHLIRGAAGALFVHAENRSGWVRHHPGRAPAWAGKRYPCPAWDAAAAEYLPTGAYGVAEPLPGGVWIRDTRDDAAVAEHWQWLASAVPCQPRAMTVVLGCPGTPDLSLDDVARFWHGLSDVDRAQARFVSYGPVRLPVGESLGQALADVLFEPVVCFAGMPVGSPGRPRMHTVDAAGRLGWPVYARELGYTPRTRTRSAGRPAILSYQAPDVLGDMIGPLTYRYTDDTVVEILQSGLWIRPPVAPGHAERVRALPADPSRHAVVVDDTEPALVPRLRELADDLVARLDDDARSRSSLRLASAVVGVAVRAPGPAGGALADGTTWRFTAADLTSEQPVVAAPVASAVSVVDEVTGVFPLVEPARPEPGPAARAAADPGAPAADRDARVDTDNGGPAADRDARVAADSGGPAADREWLRREMTDEFDAAAGAVSRIFAAHPGFHAGPETMADAVAVRLYLSPAGDGLDAALRTGRPGPHVTFARCVAAGLDRLPVHRGPAVLGAELTAADLRAIAAHRLLTDRGFTHAVAEPVAELPGTVDVLIWSITGRRTRLLETAAGVPERVLFRPGTTFKVMGTIDPGPGWRGQLLLRELEPGEPDHGHVPFDDLARSSLHRAARQWAAADAAPPLAAAATPRFAMAPGPP